MIERLSVRPLCVADSQVMAEVMADPCLYQFTGGEPPTAEQLHQRYAAQVLGGPADGSQRWINLIVLQGRQPAGGTAAMATAMSTCWKS